MPERRASTLALTATAALSVAAWVALHALNRGTLAGPPLAHPSRLMVWVAVRPVEVAAFAVLGLVAQAMAAYLIVTIAVGTVARLLSLRTVAQAFDWATVPPVRRLLTAAVGASIVALPLSSLPAGAESTGSSPPVMVALPPDTTTTTPPPVMHRLPDPTATTSQPAPSRSPTPPPTTSEAMSQPPPTTREAISQPTAPSPFASTATVPPGGNLWQVASDALAATLRRVPTAGEVAPYWLRVIQANRAHLSHADDPGLVYAGQLIELPSIDPTG